VKVQYRQFADQAGLPLIRAGVDLLGQTNLEAQDADCLSSFNGVVDWKQISSQAGVQGSEVIRGVSDSGVLTVSLVEVNEQGGLSCHELEVEGTVPDGYSSLSCLIHVVMSPSFVPEYIGIDWEDAKEILRSGRNARLALAQGDVGSSLLEVAKRVKADRRRSIHGSILVIFYRDDEFSLSSYKEARRLLKDEFDCSGHSLIAAPVVTNQPEPMLGLLAVYD